jgi:competence protein ComEC
VHLLSASGIHLYALATLVSALVAFAAPRLLLPVRLARPFARILAGGLWLSCWGLAGARPGMMRPLLLVGLRHAAEGAGFTWRPYASLVTALIVDVAAALARGESPERAAGYGLAVAGGILGVHALRRRRGFCSHLILALGSWIFLALLEAWRDSTLALATPFLSVITLPFISAGAYPALILGAIASALGLPGASAWICSSCGTVVTAVTAALAHATMAVPSLWVIPRGPLLLGCALAGPVAFLRARSLPYLAPIALGLRLLIQPAGAVESRGAAREVDQLAVGQGDSALVVDASGAGLIDTGSEHAVAESAWIGRLARSGITQLDWVALTHFDEDHAGGLHSLLLLLPVGCVESDEAQWSAPRGQKLARLVSVAGAAQRHWGSGCVPYPTLAPPARAWHAHSANAAMGAVWIPLSGGASYLSAGDATAEDEPRIGLWARALSERWGSGGRILKVSHHGSKTSSSPVFLTEFAPSELWISVGRGNLYGHPSPEVLERLGGLGVPVRRTDVDGELRAEGGRRPR